MVTKARNVRIDDELWGRIQKQAARNRRPMATEVRVALEVYALMQEKDPASVEKVLNGSRR